MAIERSWSEYYKIKWPFSKHFDAQFHERDWSMSSTITGNFTGFFRIFHFSNFVRAWIFLLGTSRERGEKTAPDRCPGVDGYLNVAREITDLYPMTSSIWRRHQFLKSGKLRFWSINRMFLRLIRPYIPARSITKFDSS